MNPDASVTSRGLCSSSQQLLAVVRVHVRYITVRGMCQIETHLR